MDTMEQISIEWNPRSPSSKLKQFENPINFSTSPSRSQTSMGSPKSRRSFDFSGAVPEDNERISEEALMMKKVLRRYENELLPGEIKQTVGYTGYHPKFSSSDSIGIPEESRDSAIWGYTGYYPGMTADKALGRSGNMRTAGFKQTNDLISKASVSKFRSAFDTEGPHVLSNGIAVYNLADDVSDAPPMKNSLSNSSSIRGIRGYTGHEPYFVNDSFDVEDKEVLPVLGYTGYYAGKNKPVIEELKQHPLSLAERMKRDIKRQVHADKEKNAPFIKPEIVYGDEMYYHKNRQFRRPITPLSPQKKK